MKVEFGSPITFWGGISIQEIPLYGTAGEVRKETREVTLELSESGGYITVPPQEIQKNVSFENLKICVCASIVLGNCPVYKRRRVLCQNRME